MQGLLTLHIANEQLCILFDELRNESLTLHVKRIQRIHQVYNKNQVIADIIEVFHNPCEEEEDNSFKLFEQQRMRAQSKLEGLLSS